MVHIETPVNPNSWCTDIQYYADKPHQKGAKHMVDSNFGPLQDPFEFGTDIVMHSATNHFGGHSVLLAGLLLTKYQKAKNDLQIDRICLGTNIGNLEASLLYRSLKTFELRVKKQSENATALVNFLVENESKFPELQEIHYSSLEKEEFVEKQLKGIHSLTFSIILKSEQAARLLSSKLKYFTHATSLGGVESLIEWRRMSVRTHTHLPFF